MIVYRYLGHEYGMLALQTHKWKVGRLLDLNDPLDCRPRFRHKGQDDIKNVPPIFANLATYTGIICYSDSIRDPVVWSHYAKVHTGMALGFDFPEKEMPSRVVYPESNLRAIVDLDMLVREAGADEAHARWLGIQTGYLAKASSWAYEREYRHFIDLHDCKMEGLHYFRMMPMDRLRRVVLGVRCPISTFDVVNAISEWVGIEKASVFRASINASSYQLDILP
jgi:hypothetical protein